MHPSVHRPLPQRTLIAGNCAPLYGLAQPPGDSRSNMRVTNANEFYIIARHAKPGNPLLRSESSGHDYFEPARQTERLDCGYGEGSKFGYGERRARPRRPGDRFDGRWTGL